MCSRCRLPSASGHVATTLDCVLKCLIRFRFLIRHTGTRTPYASANTHCLLGKTIQIDDRFSARPTTSRAPSLSLSPSLVRKDNRWPWHLQPLYPVQRLPKANGRLLFAASENPPHCSFCTSTSSWRILSGVSQQLLPHVHTSTLP